jgi:hypothetical protein
LVRPVELAAWRPPDEGGQLTLRPYEVALVLQLAEREVIALVRTGDLANVSRDSWIRLDPEQVFEEAVKRIRHGELSALALWALRDLITGARRTNHRASAGTTPETLAQFIAWGGTR